MLTSSTGAPMDGTTVIGPAVAHLMSRGPGALPATGGAPPRVAQPLPLFTVRLDHILGDTFLQSATQIGWRYLVVTGGPIAVADVTAGAPGGRSSFHRLIRGALPVRLEQAADLAAQRYGTTDPDTFEVRVLELPALYVATLWLHGLNGLREAFFPFLEGSEADRQRPVTEDTGFVPRMVREAAGRRQSP
jgi:hypothetical protein